MPVSVFDLFSVGVGPSSSHTVGPMRAARDFLLLVQEKFGLASVSSLTIDLYGSLAATGRGHGTDCAILMGLEGEDPEYIDPVVSRERWKKIIEIKSLKLLGDQHVAFDPAQSLIFNSSQRLPYHSNGLIFRVKNDLDEVFFSETYYSIGGGFIVKSGQISADSESEFEASIPFSFHSASELLQKCSEHQLTIDQLILHNERVHRSEQEIRNRIQKIAEVMFHCIDLGLQNDGVLPGLGLKRRAPGLYAKILSHRKEGQPNPGESMDWLSVFAIAVNEENAAGSRVVTAPTNGAAGIIPAVLKYHYKINPQATSEDAMKYLLTAGAIGNLYKEGASISAAEVGCQGEVGVACSMAAGALAAIWGGTLAQIENAAEIGMEHHLGLTCDPISGLVQIPCIERNAMGAVQAVNAARLALLGDGQHFVSLDQVIQTMRQTGNDMSTKYKETSEGGLALAVNLPFC